mgnify:CR=1 FL=1
MRRVETTQLSGPMGVSVALHATLVLLVLVGIPKGKTEPLPPIYKVNIVAAPAGPRAIGEVRPEPVETPPVTPTPAAPPPAPTPAREAAVPIAKASPKKQAPRTTPVETPAEASKKDAPRAGGGPIGGRGTDVATVQTEGIDFPFPGYLNNIVRQIALRFNPNDASSGLRAEVRFVIRRDGSVIGMGFVRRSGNYAFDLEAQGAVEAAAGQFGALPEGFRDDALPVVFSFDPRIIR